MTAISERAVETRPAEAAKPLMRSRLPRVLAWTWLGCVLFFIYAPILVVIASSFDPGSYVMNRAFLQFPPKGFTLHWYFNISPGLWLSMLNSFVLATAVALGAVLFGVPAALGLVRGGLPASNAISTLFRSPLQIPFIVVGVAFLQASYALAPSIGVNLHDSPAAIFLAHLLVATPYVIGATGSRLAQLSPRFDEAALTLGASRWRAFRRVTLPLILPSIFSGALFSFLVSFTDVTIALFLTPKGYVTFPIWVFHSIQNDLESSVPAASTLVFLFSAAAIFLLQRLAGMEAVLRSGGAKG
jgi:ABC-type spermidine/putrescine transport system permease subunit II